MKTLIFDLDGTMYRGNQVIESAKQFLEYCQEHKIPYLFLTNNSMRTPEENVLHMEKMGYANLSSTSFYNSAMASCEYVLEHYESRKAFYIGKDGMKQALLSSGFEIIDQDPDYVFVGLDKDASYKTYSDALKYLLNGAQLIGTNSDWILASPNGFEMGNGSIVAMFEYASKQNSPKIAKPYYPILKYCLEHYSLKKEDVLLVGDNLGTDIRLGYENQIETVFVETGVHTRQDLDDYSIKPSYTVSNLMELLKFDFL